MILRTYSTHSADLMILTLAWYNQSKPMCQHRSGPVIPTPCQGQYIVGHDSCPLIREVLVLQLHRFCSWNVIHSLNIVQNLSRFLDVPKNNEISMIFLHTVFRRKVSSRFIHVFSKLSHFFGKLNPIDLKTST